jgi:hypothetical protein
MRDIQLAALAYGFQYSCVGLFALLLPRLTQHSTTRHVTGVSIAAVLLCFQPYVYSTPTQMSGFYLATLGCLAAFSILHWTCRSITTERQPTVLQVYLSTFTHALEGVIKVHQRFLAKQNKLNRQTAPASGKAPQQQQQPMHSGSQQQCIQPSVVLVDAVWTLFVVYVTYEAGLYLLCSLSGNLCSSSNDSSSGSSTGSSMRIPPAWISTLPALVWLSENLPYLSRCAFAFPAGLFLTLPMDLIYCLVRLIMAVGSFRFLAVRQLVTAMPKRAFNWPIAAGSVGELWGFRWHQFLRFHFEGLGYGAVDAVLALLPKSLQVHDKAQTALRQTMRCVVVFLMSGLLHEYLIWAVFGRVTGQYLLFFMINCVAVVLENLQASRGGMKVPTWMPRVWTLGLFIVLGPMFIEPYRDAGFFDQRAFHLLGAPLVPRLLQYMR